MYPDYDEGEPCFKLDKLYAARTGCQEKQSGGTKCKKPFGSRHFATDPAAAGSGAKR